MFFLFDLLLLCFFSIPCLRCFALGSFKCEALLSATGRSGCIDGLNLEKLNIKTGGFD